MECGRVTRQSFWGWAIYRLLPESCEVPLLWHRDTDDRASVKRSMRHGRLLLYCLTAILGYPML
ncbi:MAG: hypothetical protein GY782_06975 [Gammaproteobacteria bacterium]|nr:hypothetical protein [Gammaproteobacteria bacterium]